MTDGVLSHLLRITLNNKLYGNSTKLGSPNYIESDGRKQKKALRELVEAGYLSQTGDEYHVTNKCWEELQTESVDLIAIWNRDRSEGWNRRRNYPFIRWQLLSWGQKKTVLMCAGHYEWHVCNHVPLQYDTPMQDGDMAGPLVEADTNLSEKLNVLEEQVRVRLKQEKRGGHFPEIEIVLKIDGLTAHVEKVLSDERFVQLYKTNLKWGLSKVGVVSEDDAKEIVTSDEPGWVLGGGGNSNLGTDPDKWGDMLKERIQNAKEGIERIKRRLAIMEQIEAGVEAKGGWEAFREQYKAKLAEELEKKNAE
jgi:hypothetical protein